VGADLFFVNSRDHIVWLAARHARSSNLRAALCPIFGNAIPMGEAQFL
jgi:hypothetical protein